MVAKGVQGAARPAAGRAAPHDRLADCDAPAFARVLVAGEAAPGSPPQAIAARAHGLDRQRLRWPAGPAAGAPSQAAVGAAEATSPSAAAWPDLDAPDTRYLLAHAAQGGLRTAPGQPVQGADALLPLTPTREALPPTLAERFKFVAPGVDLRLSPADVARLPALLRGGLRLVQVDGGGRVRRATGLQLAGTLDDFYAGAAAARDLGATLAGGRTRFALWAPTAHRVQVCLHAGPEGPARRVQRLDRDAATGVWRGSAPNPGRGGPSQPGPARGAGVGPVYTYLVDVFVPGHGLVRNRVTDPYSLALTADSRRSVAVNLRHPALAPAGWAADRTPDTVKATTDLVVYELHVRDFSLSDATVPAAQRGTYAAFTQAGSAGMRHLAGLARAGLTDVHLLPVFDIASIPERGCTTPAIPAAAPDSEAQQAAAGAHRAGDCFNWGYDPLHYTVPEGSYATDAADPAVRIREFRAMVMALHRAGLRVGMDVVYNHTPASGQHRHSVLDRIVPGYYHRLNAAGQVERSTCCDNTATEHRMMGKLMIDSVLTWAREHRIDSFRFDLMGHQPRTVMEALQQRLKAELGREVPLIGEGWDFGEVAGGARFVQASQRSLGGTGIGSFSDRSRDALRGGGYDDSGPRLAERTGWIHGPGRDAAEYARLSDLVRLGLAGTLATYRLIDASGQPVTGAQMRYGGQPGAGFATQPSEVVNYAENHDNQTLFDINVYRLPPDTSREDRARVQHLAAAVVALSQGVAYFHAGQDILRSKSLDRNSYDSGDHFNRLDWSSTDNGFGAGLPPAEDNRHDWPWMKPLLADARIKPGAAEIAWTRDAFADLLRIRASSTLFRLRTADEVQRRLSLLPEGAAAPDAALVALQLDGRGLPGAGFARVVVLINAATGPRTLTVPTLAGQPLVLHPVHRAAGAADRRAAASTFDQSAGRFEVPARTAVVFVAD